jgi:hypothetical protein
MRVDEPNVNCDQFTSYQSPSCKTTQRYERGQDFRFKIPLIFYFLFFSLVSANLTYAQTISPYCATSVPHFGGDPGSNVLLTIKNTGANSMEVRAVSANADPVDLLIVNGGSGAIISPATNPSAGVYLITLTWAGAPPANVNLNVLWSKVSFGGNWQLSMANINIPFAATCPATAPTSPYCATSVPHFGGDPGSNVLLTIKNTGANSMEVRAVSANADPVDLLIVNGGSGAIISPATNPSAGVYLITLTWAGAPPTNVNLNVLWSKVSFGGNWQLSMANVDIPFAATCPATVPTSPYCATSVTHFGGDAGSNILLTIKNTGANSMEVRAVSANADPVDLLIVNGGSGAVISPATNPSAGVYLITLTWAGAPPTNVNLNVLWSKVSFGGNWQLSMANVDIPFAATCPAAPLPTTPSSNLPNPTCSAANVINIYGGAYPTNIATNYNPNWGQSGFCCVNPNFDPGTGNVVMAYPMFNYQGTELTTTNASSMTFLNFDVWTNANPATTTLQVSPINNGTGPAEVLVTVPYTSGGWTRVSLPKSAFAGMTWNSVFQLKFAANGPGSLVPVDIYLDNIYFSNCAPTAPTTSPPNPTCAPTNVINIYGSTYPTNIATNYNPNWGQSGFCCVNPAYNPGTGNLALAYPMFNYQGTELVPTNASSMQYLHFDVWTNANPSTTTLQVSPINFGTGTMETLVTVPYTSGQWTSVILPKSAFTGMTWNDIRQLKFAANGPGSFVPVDIYLDNIYFSNCIPTAPITAAPIPTCAPTSVISMYSNAYTNVPVDTWLTPWSSATLMDIQIAGNDTKKYTNVDFFGIETVGPNLLNVSNMQYLHLDFWTPNMTTVRVKLVDFGANAIFGGGDDSEHEVILNCNTQGQWNSYHIPLSGFTSLKSKTRIAQMIISGLPTGSGTLYLDNVYFTNCAPVSPTVVAATISVTETSGAAGNDAIICAGANVTFTASGGGTYLWSTGASTSSISVTPNNNTVYTLTVTNGCTAVVSQLITVTPLPTVFTVSGGGTRCTTDGGLAITLAGSQTGVNYQLQLNGGNVGTPVAGTGAALNFPVQSTAGTYTVVATNVTTGCINNMTGNAVILVITCGATITDPCVCLNNATTPTNGQFSEVITVNAPAGQTWTVSAVSGLFTTTSPAPPAAPIAITVGTVLTASGGTYTLNGRHIDALGYTLSVTNNRGTTLTIGNSCSYPSPIISSPPAAVCLGTPYPLTGIPGDANIVSEGFTVNGVAATTFNPTATGTYTIVYTVNGGTPKAFGPNDPGCIQSITQLVEVNPLPVITLQPADTGVCDDGTAIFTVAATVAAPSTVSYQWQRQINGIWTNINGATTTTLTVSNVTDADNNSRFRVIVSSENTNGVSCPVFSNIAWLYVHTSVSMTCNGHINYSLDENCGAENFASIFLSGPNSSFFYDVIFKLGNTVIPTSQVKNYIGRVLTYEVIDICDGNKCWGTVTFEDKLPPVLNCPCSAPPANVSTMTEIARTGTKIYYRSNGTYSWQAAYAHAQSIGGQMVSINNAQENALIKAGMDANYPAGWRVWIGLTDDEAYGGSEANNNPTNGWVWTNGDGLTYTNWAAGEPNGLAGEDYAEMFATGMWNDNSNASFIQGYILEVENCTFTCAEINSVFNSTLLTLNPNLATADACGPVTSTFVDQIIGDECDGQQIIRSWYVEDQSGNTATCQQFFIFRPLTADDVTFATAEVILNCNDGTTPAEIAAALGASAAYPTVIVGGIPTALNSHVCNIYAAHTDTEIDACAPHCHGNKKVIRRWTILDWCEGTILESIQIIKAIDQEGPTFITKDTTVSTRPWDCTGEFFLPLPWELHDNCDANPTYVVTGPEGVIVTKVGNRWRASNVEKGIHTFTYTASDCCGNKGTETVNVTVLDKTPPIAIAKQDIVISLVPGYEADGSLNGQAKMFPESIDNGSFDNCSDVKLEIRRPDGAPACGNDGNITNPATGARHNNNVTFSNSPLPGFNNNINDTDGGAFVKFCCADIPAGETFGIVQVELRVWDDGNMNGIIGDAGDNYNVTWANVRVEYKVPPQITCPPDMTIYCDWAIDQNPGTSDASAKSIEGFDFTKTGLPTAISVCGSADIRFWDRLQVNQCKIGTITRTFLVGTSGVKCVQTIKVDPSLASQPWTFIPSSLSETPIAIQSCDGPTAAQIAANAPRYTSGPCDNIGVSTDVKQFDFEQGVCRKWRVEFTYDNWCTDEKRGPFYKYFVYNDVVAPELECEDKMFPVDNDCVAQVVLNKTAIDTSGCIQTGWLKWEVYVDLWADGTNDYLFTSFYAGADGAVRIIDGDAVRQYKLSGPTTNAGSDGATQSGQELRITLPDLIEGSMSNHKVVWKVTDGCHNYTSCHENFMVADKKKPTPVCVPLSTALMADPDGNGPFLPMVELWAVDFMNKAYDNCTEDDKLLYTFDNVAPQVENKTVFGRVINIDVPHYFNAASGGVCAYPAISASEIAIRNQYLRGENGLQLWLPESRSSAKVWTSSSLNPTSPDGYTTVDVMVTVWDKKFNWDFCWTSLKLGLHDGNGTGSIAGRVATSEGKSVGSVTVSIDANLPEFPKAATTPANGTFGFTTLAEGLAYEIEASKGGSYSEGVSTLDLVLIQRHILGVQALNDSYKLIAADANNDGAVTASDLIELRKLILGLTSTLNNNTSWRFAVAGTPVNVNPISFDERINVNPLTGEIAGQDFVAIKIGDVNGNASTDVTNPTVESRSNNDVNLTIAERSVEAGETVAIPVTAANFNEVFGYQFTMNLNGASFVGVESGAIEMNANNVGVLSNDVVTMSFASNDSSKCKRR